MKGLRPDLISSGDVLQSFLDAHDMFLILVSESGHILYATELITSLLGHMQTRLVGQNLYDYVPEIEKNTLRNMFNPGNAKPSMLQPNGGKILTYPAQSFKCHFKMYSGETCNLTQHLPFSCISYLRRWKEAEEPLSPLSPISPPLSPFDFNNGGGETENIPSQRTDPTHHQSCVVLFGKLPTNLTLLDLPIGVNDVNFTFDMRVSKEGNIISIESHAVLVLGYTQSELIGSRFFDYIDPYHLCDVGDHMASLFNSTCSTTNPYRMFTKGGRYIWLLSKGYLSYNPWNHKPDHILLSNRILGCDHVVPEFRFFRSRTLLPDLNSSDLYNPALSTDMTGMSPQKQSQSGQQLYRGQHGSAESSDQMDHQPSTSQGSLLQHNTPKRRNTSRDMKTETAPGNVHCAGQRSGITESSMQQMAGQNIQQMGGRNIQQSRGQQTREGDLLHQQQQQQQQNRFIQEVQQEMEKKNNELFDMQRRLLEQQMLMEQERSQFYQVAQGVMQCIGMPSAAPLSVPPMLQLSGFTYSQPSLPNTHKKHLSTVVVPHSTPSSSLPTPHSSKASGISSALGTGSFPQSLLESVSLSPLQLLQQMPSNKPAPGVDSLPHPLLTAQSSTVHPGHNLTSSLSPLQLLQQKPAPGVDSLPHPLLTAQSSTVHPGHNLTSSLSPLQLLQQKPASGVDSLLHPLLTAQSSTVHPGHNLTSSLSPLQLLQQKPALVVDSLPHPLLTAQSSTVHPGHNLTSSLSPLQLLQQKPAPGVDSLPHPLLTAQSSTVHPGHNLTSSLSPLQLLQQKPASGVDSLLHPLLTAQSSTDHPGHNLTISSLSPLQLLQQKPALGVDSLPHPLLTAQSSTDHPGHNLTSSLSPLQLLQQKPALGVDSLPHPLLMAQSSTDHLGHNLTSSLSPLQLLQQKPALGVDSLPRPLLTAQSSTDHPGHNLTSSLSPLQLLQQKPALGVDSLPHPLLTAQSSTDHPGHNLTSSLSPLQLLQQKPALGVDSLPRPLLTAQSSTDHPGHNLTSSLSPLQLLQQKPALGVDSLPRPLLTAQSSTNHPGHNLTSSLRAKHQTHTNSATAATPSNHLTQGLHGLPTVFPNHPIQQQLPLLPTLLGQQVQNNYQQQQQLQQQQHLLQQQQISESQHQLRIPPAQNSIPSGMIIPPKTHPLQLSGGGGVAVGGLHTALPQLVSINLPSNNPLFVTATPSTSSAFPSGPYHNPFSQLIINSVDPHPSLQTQANSPSDSARTQTPSPGQPQSDIPATGVPMRLPNDEEIQSLLDVIQMKCSSTSLPPGTSLS